MGTPQLQSHCTVVIHVIDDNDMAPQFENVPDEVEIGEDAEPGDLIIDIDAVDHDATLANNVVYYR